MRDKLQHRPGKGAGEMYRPRAEPQHLPQEVGPEAGRQTSTKSPRLSLNRTPKPMGREPR